MKIYLLKETIRFLEKNIEEFLEKNEVTVEQAEAIAEYNIYTIGVLSLFITNIEIEADEKN